MVVGDLVPFLGVHEEAVLDCCVVCGEGFEEEDCGADVGGVGCGKELEVSITASWGVLVGGNVVSFRATLVWWEVGDGVWGVKRFDGVLNAADGLLLEDVAGEE